MFNPTDLLLQVQQLGQLGYWIVFIFSLGESLPLVGLLLPGTVIVVVFGFFSAQGYLNLGNLIWIAALGATLGDYWSYRIGTKGVHVFKAENRILKLSHLERATTFFKKHGNKSIFFGRFLGPVRSMIPFVAGLSGMRQRDFLIWNVLGAVVWAVAYLLLGYFFGGVFETIETWSSRLGVVFISLVLLIIFIRFFARRIGKFFAFVVSLIRSIFITVIDHPEIQQWMKRHPLLVHFFRRRFNRRTFSGFPLTVIVLVFAYLVFALIGLTEGVLQLQKVVDVDLRLDHVVTQFRDPIFIRIFLWITALGTWEVISTIVLSMSVVWWLWGRRSYILGLLTSLGGTLLLSYVLKILVDRPRPLEAVYLEASASFPSAHAALAVAVFGFIAYGLIRQTRRWEIKANVLFLAGVFIVMVGLSRIYLGVHYASDVWSGFLLGALWLLLGIAMTEWLQENFSKVMLVQRHHWGRLIACTASLMVFQLFFTGAFATTFEPTIRSLSNPSFAQQITNPGKLFTHTSLPAFTETLSGDPYQPIQLILVSRNTHTLVSAFHQAGWYTAEAASWRSLWQYARAVYLKNPYPEAPVSPTFWNTDLQTISFEQPTATNSVTQRHHVRVWTTPFTTDTGETVFVATANQDTDIQWLIQRSIHPNLDQERAFVVTSLEQAGVVETGILKPLVNPMSTSDGNQSFFTDGQVFILYLKN